MQRNLFIDGSLDSFVALTAAENRVEVFYMAFHCLCDISQLEVYLFLCLHPIQRLLIMPLLCCLRSPSHSYFSTLLYVFLLSQLPLSSYSFLSRLHFLGGVQHLKYNCQLSLIIFWRSEVLRNHPIFCFSSPQIANEPHAQTLLIYTSKCNAQITQMLCCKKLER